MRTFKARSGPFKERPFYTPMDVEQLCKTELANQGLLPSTPEPIRIERFVEKRFGVHVIYDNLPSGVLGWTEFGETGVQAIVVARWLADDMSRVAERRVTTTLAHEAGHGLLHGHLFALSSKTPSLFGEGSDVEGRRVLCREDEPGDRKRTYSGRWWEFQANQAMSTLLLPASLVDLALAPFLESAGRLGAVILPDSNREAATRHLSTTFDVNPVVVRIRLSELHPQNKGGQLTL